MTSKSQIQNDVRTKIEILIGLHAIKVRHTNYEDIRVLSPNTHIPHIRHGGISYILSVKMALSCQIALKN